MYLAELAKDSIVARHQRFQFQSLASCFIFLAEFMSKKKWNIQNNNTKKNNNTWENLLPHLIVIFFFNRWLLIRTKMPCPTTYTTIFLCLFYIQSPYSYLFSFFDLSPCVHLCNHESKSISQPTSNSHFVTQSEISISDRIKKSI